MILKKRFLKGLVSLLGAMMFSMPLAGCGSDKTIGAGENWEIAETARLTHLTISADATITPPDGHSVTMTVDQVERAIEPGDYQGDIRLTVAKEIENPIVMGGGSAEGDPGAPGGGATDTVRAAVYIDSSGYVPEKSVSAAVAKGTVTGTSATDVSIRSVGEDFNGIIVTGDAAYSIDSPEIYFNGGDQGNNGAAITSSGNADVTVNNAKIFSKGVQRAAIVVGGNSTMHVNDSDIEAQDGNLLERFAEMEESNSMEVPWVLGFIGNNRATNVVGSGTAYFNNTHVKAQRWGCLSTDAVQDVKLYATDCTVETVESGYGSYADGSTNIFSRCTFNVNDYGFIMTRGTAVFTDGCAVTSGRIGIMSHQGSGTVTIEKGSEFNSKEAVIQVKSGHPTFIVDGAKLNSESGVILQAMVNDDPWAASFGGGMPPGGGMPGGPGGPGGPGAPAGSADQPTEISATFRNMTLSGDMVTSITPESDVVVNFENATITGAITTATAQSQADIDGITVTKKYYYYIGAVKNTYCHTDDKYGMKVSLDGKSRWIVDKTSYLTDLTISEGAEITAPDGFTLKMVVDGAEKEIKAGKYSGSITLSVIKS